MPQQPRSAGSCLEMEGKFGVGWGCVCVPLHAPPDLLPAFRIVCACVRVRYVQVHIRMYVSFCVCLQLHELHMCNKL